MDFSELSLRSTGMPNMYFFLSIVKNHYSACVLKLLNCVHLFGTLWTRAHQAPLSMGCSRQPRQYTVVGCHFVLQEIFPIQGSNPCLLHLLHWQADSLPLRYLGSPNQIACMHAKSLQSCLTLCDPMDHSLPGSSAHGILQARYWSGLSWPPPRELSDPWQGILYHCVTWEAPVRQQVLLIFSSQFFA